MTRWLVVLSVLAMACGGDGDPQGPPLPGALRFTAISAGYYHTCALAVSGAVYCWGNNDFGTLGDGTSTTRTSPTRVANGLTYNSIDAGAGHNCALAPNGIAECWGQNDEGQVGDGSFVRRDRPVPVTGNLVFKSVTAGHAHSCGVTHAGVGYCWGDNTQRQLGAGAEAPSKSATPVRVQFEGAFAHVIAGYYQTCALTAAGEAYCWGLGGTALPARVEPTRTFTALSPGDRFVCGISAGRVICWSGGSTADYAAAKMVFSSMGQSTIQDAQNYSCAIASDDSAFCWGGAIRGFRQAGSFEALDANHEYAAIATGAMHVCAITTSGYAYCGGANYTGQLGDGTHADRASLVPVAAPVSASGS